MPIMVRTMYDLDGTLSRLNNTWDFILPYLYEHSRTRYYLVRVFNALTDRLAIAPYYIRRRWQIRLAFDRLNKRKLEKHFYEVYRQRFLNSLTRLGTQAMTEGGTILTGCTEIPARQIAGVLGMPAIYSKFSFRNGRIKGLRTDTYGALKAEYIDSDTVYYTDTPRLERELRPLLKEMIIANEK